MNSRFRRMYFDDFRIVRYTGIVGIEDYYPFGLTFNSFSRESSTPNMYRYNGKEKQDELDLGWLDYGARMYMAEIGRWGVYDPKAQLLEMSSPYVYSLNSPINFIDPDGELPIYINGRVSGGDSERASATYWSGQLLETIASSGIPNPGGEVHFVDGDRYMYSGVVKLGSDGYGRFEGGEIKNGTFATGNLPGKRSSAGYAIGKEDFQNILAKLERDPKTNKIIEKIQIYTHSRGAAFAIGYTQALLEMIEKHADEFEDPNNVVEYSLHLAPHQSTFTRAIGDNVFTMHHDEDLFSGNNMRGATAAFSSITGLKTIQAHSTNSFVKEVRSFLKAYQEARGDNKKLIRSFVRRMRAIGIKVTVK